MQQFSKSGCAICLLACPLLIVWRPASAKDFRVCQMCCQDFEDVRTDNSEMDNTYGKNRGGRRRRMREQRLGPREHDVQVYQGSQLDLRFFGGGVECVSIVEGNLCVDFVNGGRITCVNEVIWIEPERQ
jgi:hypothetical protein